MEIHEGVIYIILAGILSIFSYASLKKYAYMVRTNEDSRAITELRAANAEILRELDKAKNYLSVMKGKYRRVQQEYDLDLDDADIDPEAPDETKISDLVSSIFPQLPKKLTELADREDVLEMFTNIATKHPDKIGKFFDKMTKSKDDNPAPTQQKIPFGI